ncbi:MAG: hypothetical protein A2Y15_06300 [Clostridiales bacterium GWF2_36_10]|nr:MAG: hypothetical protein A2Y15_06300 [Clostridiales bacterium GWF2_36_10]HAN21871.1 hypothetical protein [Clostridiales bacterium]
MEFEIMIKEAEKVLDKSENAEGVVTSFLTDKGNLYNDFSQSFEDEFYKVTTVLKDMIATGETRILKLVCVFKFGKHKGLELPSGWYRRFLYDMNNNNLNTKVILQGKDNLIIKDIRMISIIKDGVFVG